VHDIAPDQVTAGARASRWCACLLAWALGFALTWPVIAFAGDPAPLGFTELYKSQGVLGNVLSDKTRALDGKPVRILGYLAPPLKPDVRFFVLTRAPVALCPFCSSDADWPSDIVVVYPRERAAWHPDGTPVAVSGALELGSKIDAETGFVSVVRIVDATVQTVQ
jgi:hypothetical protein